MRNNADFQASALFHGTHHPFQIGDVIEPRLIDPGNPYARESDAKAWATTDEESAFRFGGRKTGKAPKVFQVEPIEKGEPQFLTEAHNNTQVFSKKGFRVVKQVR